MRLYGCKEGCWGAEEGLTGEVLYYTACYAGLWFISHQLHILTNFTDENIGFSFCVYLRLVVGWIEIGKNSFFIGIIIFLIGVNLTMFGIGLS